MPMLTGSGRRASVLLKGRPTERQLADRCRPPLPEGLELYLDTVDVDAPGWLNAVVDRLAALRLPADFALIVEGPMRSLDGTFFDASADSPANREVVDRLVALARAIGARAVNVHAIAPTQRLDHPAPVERRQLLAAALPLLGRLVARCREADLVPLVENIPPLARMREGRFMSSLFGIQPSDLVWLCRMLPGLRVTLDVSHAQLCVNFTRGVADPLAERFSPLCRALEAQPEAPTLMQYAASLNGLVENVHVSNAVGLLGEGMPYDQGDIEMDPMIRYLGGVARYLVTETLEADPDDAVLMREAQRRMLVALGAVGRTETSRASWR
ncbi:MAG: hypothetical protein HY331_09730 [Chloroflexi bacterium]|nr:hypothetical protein [Chloroflexota bacterium]